MCAPYNIHTKAQEQGKNKEVGVLGREYIDGIFNENGPNMNAEYAPKEKMWEYIFWSFCKGERGVGADTAEALMTWQTWVDSTLQTERERERRVWWGGGEGGKTVVGGGGGGCEGGKNCGGGVVWGKNVGAAQTG